MYFFANEKKNQTFNRPWRKDTKWTFVNLIQAGSLTRTNWRSMFFQRLHLYTVAGFEKLVIFL